MTDNEKIKREGIKLIEEFSKMLENIPETKETHYVADIKNVTRKDDVAVPKREFPGSLQKIAPKWEDGFVVAEKGV